jgi:hypothetical protein
MSAAAFEKIYEFYLQQREARPASYSHARGIFHPADIFSSAELERHLNNPLLSPAWVQVVEKGRIVDLKEMCFSKNVQGRDLFFMDKTLLQQSIQRGAAVVLEGLDILDARLNSFVAALDQALPCALSNCETFFSQAGNEAYYGHRDSDDVLVLQIEGRKIWHLYEPQPRRYFGNSPLSEEEMGPKQIELELKPGDALYVRAGVPHRCQTPGPHSLHVSFDLIDKTPNVEQLAREANERYFHGSAEPYVSAREMMDHYVKIIRGPDFQAMLEGATRQARKRSEVFRRVMGRTSAVKLPGGAR